MSQFDNRAGLGGAFSDPRPAPSDEATSLDSSGGLEPNGFAPRVAGSSLAGASVAGVAGAAVLLGLVVFLWMSSHRPRPTADVSAPALDASAAVAPPAAPPPDIVAMEAASRAAYRSPSPVAPAAAAPPAPPVTAPPPAVPPPPPPARSPVLVVDLAEPASAAPAATVAAAPKEGTAQPVDLAKQRAAQSLSGDELFAQRVETDSEPDHARATVLRHKGSVVAQGAMIPAVLETALDSDLPGFARAVVSRDVRSFDGLAVLIPRGSRVIGEYRPATALGQSRAFVIWTRVLRPDGVSIQIGSPATDPLGRAGLSGTVDNHFFQRFGGAILLSVVNAGATALAGSPSTEVVIGSSQQATGLAATASAFAPANIAPTIKVPQGSPIRIFVARDLEFSAGGRAVNARATSAGGVYLDAYLKPLAAWLQQPDVTDILINAPGEVWVETLAGPASRRPAPELTDTALWRLAAQIAAAAHQGLNREHPLLSATLPNGARVQIVAPPATRGAMAIAIRKHVVNDLTLDDYAASGAFDQARRVDLNECSAIDVTLQALLDEGQIAAFLRTAVGARKNIVVSGGTSTGKTTFLNALAKEIPPHERLILIEDAPEVKLAHENAIGLIAVRGALGEASVTVEDLLQASLRMRPDRIILGELRGAEAYSFLRAVNSGHPGSITTVHADSPSAALDQIALMVLQGGANLRRSEIVAYVQGVVDVAVQLTRNDEGKRIVSDIGFTPRGAGGDRGG